MRLNDASQKETAVRQPCTSSNAHVLLEEVLLHEDPFQTVCVAGEGHARRKTVEVPLALLSFSTCCGILIIRSTRTDLSGSAMILTRNT